jgi:hypothetical protein
MYASSASSLCYTLDMYVKYYTTEVGKTTIKIPERFPQQL